jgi:hypothetical protein
MLQGNKAVVEINGMQQQTSLAPNVKPEYLKIGVEGEVTVKNGILTYFNTGIPQNTSQHFARPASNYKQEEKTEFWSKKHVVKSGLSDIELEKLLDDLGNTNGESFTYATQTHFVDGKWNVVVFIREKPLPESPTPNEVGGY